MITNHPLILNITNSVTIDFVANALLAAGASPVMSEDPQDSIELANISSGICLNIGTIHDKQMDIMMNVISSASQKPIALDPVGSGATSVRTDASSKILKSGKISLIRGNASEISSLSGNLGSTKGVDSTESTLSVKDSAKSLAKEFNCLVVVSGEVDLITDGTKMARAYNGSPLMPKITGTGCVLTSFLTGVIAGGKGSMEDVAEAVAYYGYLGEIAEKLAQGTGSFKYRFLDALSNVPYKDVKEHLKLEISG